MNIYYEARASAPHDEPHDDLVAAGGGGGDEARSAALRPRLLDETRALEMERQRANRLGDEAGALRSRVTELETELGRLALENARLRRRTPTR